MAKHGVPADSDTAPSQAQGDSNDQATVNSSEAPAPRLELRPLSPDRVVVQLFESSPPGENAGLSASRSSGITSSTEHVRDGADHGAKIVEKARDPDAATATERAPALTRSTWMRLWRRGKSSLVDSWVVEIATLSLGSACLMAIVVLIAVFHDESLSKWHSYFSINTLVSTLGTLMNGCILLATTAALGQMNWIWTDHQSRPFQDFISHDEASRGPLGAASLLYRLGLRHFASLGCLTILLSVVSGPSLQASVEISTRETHENDSASIPVLTEFTDHGSGAGPYPGPVLAALLEGLLHTTGAPLKTNLDAACPSGNCTYGSFPSIGVCSICANVEELNVEETTNLPFNQVGTGKVVSMANGDGSPNLFVERLAGNANFFNFTYTENNATAVLATDDGSGSTNYLPDPNSLPLLSYLFMATTNAFGMRVNDPDDQNNLDWLNSTSVSHLVQAMNCTLSVCAQDWTSAVTDGKLRESIISHEPNGHYDASYYDSAGVGVTQFFYFRGGNYTKLFADASLVNDLATALFSNDLLGSHTIKLLPEDDVDDDGENSRGLYYLFTHDFDQIPDRFDQAALSLSLTLRSWASTNTGPSGLHNGTAISTEAYFKVHWPFLTVPLLMLVLSLIFVALTIWQSHLRMVPLWKTSLLASVVHARAIVAPTSAEKLIKLSELEEWAKTERTTVRRRRI